MQPFKTSHNKVKRSKYSSVHVQSCSIFVDPMRVVSHSEQWIARVHHQCSVVGDCFAIKVNDTLCHSKDLLGVSDCNTVECTSTVAYPYPLALIWKGAVPVYVPPNINKCENCNAPDPVTITLSVKRTAMFVKSISTLNVCQMELQEIWSKSSHFGSTSNSFCTVVVPANNIFSNPISIKWNGTFVTFSCTLSQSNKPGPWNLPLTNVCNVFRYSTTCTEAALTKPPPNSIREAKEVCTDSSVSAVTPNWPLKSLMNQGAAGLVSWLTSKVPLLHKTTRFKCNLLKVLPIAESTQGHNWIYLGVSCVKGILFWKLRRNLGIWKSNKCSKVLEVIRKSNGESVQGRRVSNPHRSFGLNEFQQKLTVLP